MESPSMMGMTMRLAKMMLALGYAMIAFLACNSASLATSHEGVYDAEASLGDNTLPARIELERWEGGYRGRLTISLGTEFHVALRSTAIVADTVTFATSSPVTEMRVSFDADSLTGRVWLAGNRELSLAGVLLDGEVASDSLATQFSLDPWEPDAISQPARGEAFPTFSLDGQTIYFSAYEKDFSLQTIMRSHFRNGTWSQPAIVSFSGGHSDRAPMISPDGTRLVFASMRPHGTDNAASTSYNLWEVDVSQVENGFEPQFLSVSSAESDYQPSFTDDGAIYFSSERPGGFGGQDVYRWDGVGSVENLGPVINSDADEMSAFIDPLGNYIIFSTSSPHPGHVGNDDLYISFRQGTEWSAPAHLGVPINSFANEYGAIVSANGQYLYFTSDRHPPANIYRVEVGEILTRGGDNRPSGRH